jgi:hypothetical protein
MTNRSSGAGEDAVELRVRAALRAQASTITALPPRRPIGDDDHHQWGRGYRWRATLLSAAAVIVIVVGIAVGFASSRGGGGHAPAAATSTPPPTTPSAPTSSTAPTPTSTSSSGSSSPITFSPGHLALWPFTSTGEELDWQSAYASSGTDAWHLDADATAIRFATDYLGFADMNTVTSREAVSGTIEIGVGFGEPGNATAAVITLERSSTSSPWEATGATSSALSITSPTAGAGVSSNITVSGLITGVDENIKVTVRQLGTTPIAESCCQPAGGTNTPWSNSVAVSNAQPGVAVIVASTGGHLEAVEKFVVIGVLLS